MLLCEPLNGEALAERKTKELSEWQRSEFRRKKRPVKSDKSASGSRQQVLVLSVGLLLLRERRSLLLTGWHLAGLVQDDKEDEDEDADH